MEHGLQNSAHTCFCDSIVWSRPAEGLIHSSCGLRVPATLTMADLEAVLADVSYLMAMEKSKCTPAARASKKIVLPDPRSVEQRREGVLITRIDGFE